MARSLGAADRGDEKGRGLVDDWVEEIRSSRVSEVSESLAAEGRGSGGPGGEGSGGFGEGRVDEARLLPSSGSEPREAGDGWVEPARLARSSGSGGRGAVGSGDLGDGWVDEVRSPEGGRGSVDARRPQVGPGHDLPGPPTPSSRAASPSRRGGRADGESGRPAGARGSRKGGREGASSAEAGAAGVVDPVQQAKEICLRLLTARPRTRVELAQALTRKGVEADVVEQVLSRLDEVGLIDDAAFAEMWVRSRHGFQGLSRRALAVELRRKGVTDESAAEALASVDSDAEEERARQLVRKRLRALGGADETTKVRKLVGMLARKGYSEGLAYRVVKDEVRTSLLDDAF